MAGKGELRRLMNELRGLTPAPKRVSFWDLITFEGSDEEYAALVDRLGPEDRRQVEEALAACRKSEEEGPPPWTCDAPGCGFMILQPGDRCHLCGGREYRDADGRHHRPDGGPAGAPGGVSEEK